MSARTKAPEAEAPDTDELEEEELEEAEREADELEEEEAEEADTEETGGLDPEAFEREQRRHEKAMRELLGSAFEDLVACEACGGVGLHPGDLVQPPPPLPDPDAVECPTCNGYGMRVTPSRVETAMTVTCPKCNGAGWRDRRQIEAESQAAAWEAQAQAAPTPPPMPGQPVWDQARGVWVTPDGNPIYAPPVAPLGT